MPDSVTAFGPASLSNLGPGFDALGLCVTGLGDHVEAWRTDAPGVTIEGPPSIPTDPEKNTAGRAALHVLRTSGAEGGVGLRIEKGVPLGSGVGGSAASAVAGAWAANAVLGSPFDKPGLVDAVLEGEFAASGSYHGDNVLPALFGGLVLTSPSDPRAYRRLALPEAPPIAVIVPHVEVLTRQARAVLPGTVPHKDASAQAAELAFLLAALLEGDWAEVGTHLMRDRLAEPHRATLVPVYRAVKAAALDAGAAGCALTGSGPAMFAIPSDGADADAILTAMVDASREGAIDAHGWVAEVDTEGVRTI
ncbi:homoserine kinase [Rubrivirga marina]|uniref:Homoserine kinase n=1 Tax=Rubrivirga marina TaxID=1196024 RepID=A0A271IWJ3_9BACT|nr:homoserine kinase [Rubrivirga marina]PAP75184.1 homoserine kinase [Rubrivirga marina]